MIIVNRNPELYKNSTDLDKFNSEVRDLIKECGISKAITDALIADQIEALAEYEEFNQELWDEDNTNYHKFCDEVIESLNQELGYD